MLKCFVVFYRGDSDKRAAMPIRSKEVWASSISGAEDVFRSSWASAIWHMGSSYDILSIREVVKK